MCSSDNRKSQIANRQSLPTLAPLDGAVRLNVGCGDCPHLSYYNVDNNREVAIPFFNFIQADAHALPVASESVDVVYASHLLEHYPVLAAPEGTATASDALREWYRVLRPGGVLYVAVPAFELIARMCLANGPQQDHWMLRVFGQPRPGMSHCWAYTTRSLAETLRLHGFREVVPFEPFMTTPAGGFDASGAAGVRQDGAAIALSLNLKARKPPRPQDKAEVPQ